MDQHAVISYASAEILPRIESSAALASPPPSLDGSTHLEERAVYEADNDAGSPPPLSAAPPASIIKLRHHLDTNQSHLSFNERAQATLGLFEPRQTTIHFTFGSSVMMDFVRNWLHFVTAARLEPFLIGAADLSLLTFCNEERVPAAAIKPELDVWTYRLRRASDERVYTMHAKWKYFRHHDSDFLEMGLVKVSARRRPSERRGPRASRRA